MRTVDLFAGAGGWDEGIRQVYPDGHLVGIELDKDACATAELAGHARVQADVTTLDPAEFGPVDLLVASPPCTAFSMAGKGAGREVLGALVAHALGFTDAGWSRFAHDDPAVGLVLEPLRWVESLRPRWVMFEQVPSVMPVWQACVQVLKSWGYSASARVINAADLGVPQTRKRAFLIACLEGPVVWPEPSHHPTRRGTMPLGEGWQTMGEALDVDGALHFGNALNDVRWEFAGAGRTARESAGQQRRTLEEPAHTITGADTAAWVHERPATTNVGSFCPDVVAAPGYRGPGDGPRQNAPGSVRITIEQASILQGFRPDYPWQGSRTSQFRQCGNAVVPAVAAALTHALTVASGRR